MYICYCPLRDPNWNKNIVLYCIVLFISHLKIQNIRLKKHLSRLKMNCFFSLVITTNIAFAGDFSSRTSNVSDIVELDDNLFDMLDISDVPEYFNVNMLSNYKLAEMGIPLERFSEDKARVNKYGQKLVELCKRCSLYIANGRVYKDKFIGGSTCKDTSLVDYLILSSNLFHILADFEVLNLFYMVKRLILLIHTHILG